MLTVSPDRANVECARQEDGQAPHYCEQPIESAVEAVISLLGEAASRSAGE